MRHIMVLNAKGGCGKSTLATNIAAYFANEGASVALADFDPQRSSLDWLERRPDNRPKIAAIAAFEDGLRHVPRTADIVVSDATARSRSSAPTTRSSVAPRGRSTTGTITERAFNGPSAAAARQRSQQVR